VSTRGKAGARDLGQGLGLTRYRHSYPQIVKESFVEDVNNLLNAGEVPELGSTRLLWWGGSVRCFAGVY